MKKRNRWIAGGAALLVLAAIGIANARSPWLHRVTSVSEWDGYRAVNHLFLGRFSYYDDAFDAKVSVSPDWLRMVSPSGIRHLAGYSPNDPGARCLHLWKESNGDSYRLIQRGQEPVEKVIDFYKRQLTDVTSHNDASDGIAKWSLEGTCPDGKTRLMIETHGGISARRTTFLLTWIPSGAS